MTNNDLGIPAAVFVDDIDKFMSQDENKNNVESVLSRFDEQFSKYKFMEINLSRKKQILQKQVPEFKASLDMLKVLKFSKEKEEIIDTNFMINEDLYVKAKIPPTDKIGLWLGANVMLEYELQDAEDLLNKNSKAAEKTLHQIEVDLDFLREQLTTIEVNMARVYNWNVKH